MYKHSFSIDTNYQNASAFLLALNRMGKTQRCTNYTVQISNGAEFHTILGTKLSSIIMTFYHHLPILV